MGNQNVNYNANFNRNRNDIRNETRNPEVRNETHNQDIRNESTNMEVKNDSGVSINYVEKKEETIEMSREPKVRNLQSTQRLNLRNSPSKEGKIILVLNSEDTLCLVEYVNETWAQVITDNNTSGYVMREYVKEV